MGRGYRTMTPTKPEDALVEQIRALQKRATPGPWEAHGGYLHRQHWLIDAPGRRFIATIDGPPDEVGEADAHLIALVPQMADVITTLLERERLAIEALTPSAETKAAYIGEFKLVIDDYDESGNETHRWADVPWTTIKEIMAAIKARAALTGENRDQISRP